MGFKKKHLPLLFLAMVIFILGSNRAVMAKPEQSGLLLGLRRHVSAPVQVKGAPDSKAVYRTIWIYPLTDGYNNLWRQDLMVPRDAGFYQVATRRLTSGRWTEDAPFAVPLGKNPNPRLSINPQNTEGYRFCDILFAGTNHISMEGHSWGYTKGAAHPWEYHYLEVDAYGNMNQALPISRVIGEYAWRSMRQSGINYWKAHPKSQEKLYLEPSDSGWGLIRAQGRWFIRGMLNYSAEVFRGAYAFFDVNVTAPARLVSHDGLPVSWKSVRGGVPGAIDAFASPTGDVLVVMTTRKLLVFRNANTPDFSSPVEEINLFKGEAPVMVQWAVGSYVDRWTGTLFP